MAGTAGGAGRDSHGIVPPGLAGLGLFTLYRANVNKHTEEDEEELQEFVAEIKTEENC